MLLRTEDLNAAYRQIVEDATVGGGVATSVLILVAPSTDAMCACRILCSLLRSDAVGYSVQPVGNYSRIVQLNKDVLQGSEDVKSVVMIECGATVDVNFILSHLPDESKVYIADSHRPIHLTNIHAGERVVILGDGILDDADFPSDGEFIGGVSDSDSAEDDSDTASDNDGDSESGHQSEFEEEFDKSDSDNIDSDKEEEERGGADERERKGRIKAVDEDREGGYSGSEENDSDSDMHEELGKERRKRSRPHSSAAKSDDLRQKGSSSRAMIRRRKTEAISRKERIRQYYHLGSWCGPATAVTLYHLARQMDKDDNDSLWLAIVGFTDQFIHSRIDQELYVNLVDEFSSYVIATNPLHRPTMKGGDGKLVPVAEGGRIAFEMEYRFMHHRHWSLYEAMYFSNYIASKLEVWSSRGKARLEEFLAKMGVGLQQCKQKFPFMSSQLRARLRQQLTKYMEEYGLEDIFYGSFQRFLGFNTTISAADMVYTITALLEQHAETDEDAWLDGFNMAYDALGSREVNGPAMRRGLERSMSLQKIIVQQAVSIIERGQVACTPRLRYVFIHSDSSMNGTCTNGNGGLETALAHPLALVKLATFLINVHHEKGKWAGAKARPLVLLAQRPQTYLVVAVTVPDSHGSAARNRFGEHFRLTIKDMKDACVRHDGFDTSVLEIHKDNVALFMERLSDAVGAV